MFAITLFMFIQKFKMINAWLRVATNIEIIILYNRVNSNRIFIRCCDQNENSTFDSIQWLTNVYLLKFKCHGCARPMNLTLTILYSTHTVTVYCYCLLLFYTYFFLFVFILSFKQKINNTFFLFYVYWFNFRPIINQFLIFIDTKIYAFYVTLNTAKYETLNFYTNLNNTFNINRIIKYVIFVSFDLFLSTLTRR